MRPLVFAILFDAFCVLVISVLLWRDLLPRELGAGLLGAIIGVRARGRTHDDDGPGGHGTPRQSAQVGGHDTFDRASRGVLEESALGQLLHWSRWVMQ